MHSHLNRSDNRAFVDSRARIMFRSLDTSKTGIAESALLFVWGAVIKCNTPPREGSPDEANPTRHLSAVSCIRHCIGGKLRRRARPGSCWRHRSSFQERSQLDVPRASANEFLRQGKTLVGRYNSLKPPTAKFRSRRSLLPVYGNGFPCSYTAGSIRS